MHGQDGVAAQTALSRWRPLQIGATPAALNSTHPVGQDHLQRLDRIDQQPLLEAAGANRKLVRQIKPRPVMQLDDGANLLPSAPSTRNRGGAETRTCRQKALPTAGSSLCTPRAHGL